MGSLTKQQQRISATVLALVLALAGQPLRAQSATTWIVGGGFSLPTGEFNSYANKGWGLAAGMEHRLGHSGAAIRLDGGLAKNNDTTGLGVHESTRLITATGSVVYHFDGARPHLYVLAGAGLLNRHFTSDDPEELPITDNRGVVQVAEGVIIPIGRLRTSIEGRFVTTVGPGAFQFFTVTAGLRFRDRS